MNNKDLDCFIKVYEGKSISAAARELYMSPQAVSKIIRRIEEELDADLFDRTAGGMRPTAYGDLFYPHAVRILDEYQKSLLAVRQMKLQNEGILKLVSAFGILRFLSPEFIGCFSRQHPEIHIDYMEFPDRYIEEQVLDGKYDLGMTPYLYRNPDLHYIPLFSREIYFVTNESSRFYECGEVSVHDIAQEPLIIENRNFLIHHIMTDLCSREGCSLNIYFNTSGFSLCYKLCKEGEGNTVSMDFIYDDMGDASLKMIPFREHPMWNIALIMRKDAPCTDNMRIFTDFAVQWCRVL